MHQRCKYDKHNRLSGGRSDLTNKGFDKCWRVSFCGNSLSRFRYPFSPFSLGSPSQAVTSRIGIDVQDAAVYLGSENLHEGEYSNAIS